MEEIVISTYARHNSCIFSNSNQKTALIDYYFQEHRNAITKLNNEHQAEKKSLTENYETKLAEQKKDYENQLTEAKEKGNFFYKLPVVASTT